MKMKNNLFKLYILCAFLLTDFVLFAQPGQDQGGGGLEGDDPPVASIDEKLIWLGMIAILFAFHMYKNRSKQVL